MVINGNTKTFLLMLYTNIPYLNTNCEDTVGSGLVGSAICTVVCGYLPYLQTVC